MILTGVMISGAGIYAASNLVLCFGVGILCGVASRMLDDES